MSTLGSVSGLNRVSAYFLFGAIALAPLPFGSAHSVTIALWCIYLGVGVLAAAPHKFQTGHAVLLAGTFLLFGLYGFVLHEQLAQIPWVAKPNPIWADASKTLGISIEPSVSIMHRQPFNALGAPLVAMLALILGMLVGTDYSRARSIMQVIAWSGGAYAIYGIIAFVIDPTTILWRQKEAYIESLTATFINRNTAAVYFGACSIVWLLLLLEHIRRRLPREAIAWRKLPARILSNTPRSIASSFVMLFVCIAAMFMTGSRSGVLLSLLALVMAVIIFLRRDLPHRSSLLVATAGGAIAVLLLVALMGGTVGGRLDTQELSGGGRIETYLSTLRMIADHPWFGTGLGTFEWSYPAYRSSNASLWGVWDKAHSTPLEIAAELGIPLAVAIILGWLSILCILVRGIVARRHNGTIPLAGFAVAMLALIHSIADFSLQIPGFSIVVFALVGVAVAQSIDPGESTQVRKRRKVD